MKNFKTLCFIRPDISKQQVSKWVLPPFSYEPEIHPAASSEFFFFLYLDILFKNQKYQNIKFYMPWYIKKSFKLGTFPFQLRAWDPPSCFLRMSRHRSDPENIQHRIGNRHRQEYWESEAGIQELLRTMQAFLQVCLLIYIFKLLSI